MTKKMVLLVVVFLVACGLTYFINMSKGSALSPLWTIGAVASVFVIFGIAMFYHPNPQN